MSCSRLGAVMSDCLTFHWPCVSTLLLNSFGRLPITCFVSLFSFVHCKTSLHGIWGIRCHFVCASLMCITLYFNEWICTCSSHIQKRVNGTEVDQLVGLLWDGLCVNLPGRFLCNFQGSASLCLLSALPEGHKYTFSLNARPPLFLSTVTLKEAVLSVKSKTNWTLPVWNLLASTLGTLAAFLRR